MEWSVCGESGRYKVNLLESDGSVSATPISRDGDELDIGKRSVRPDGKPGRAIVELGGATKLAHVARSGDSWWVHVDGRAHEIRFHEQGSKGPSYSDGSLTAPMPGTILELLVKQGQRVRQGQSLVVLEAMKMEHRISAPKAGEITKLHYDKGDRVEMGSVLIEIGD